MYGIEVGALDFERSPIDADQIGLSGRKILRPNGRNVLFIAHLPFIDFLYLCFGVLCDILIDKWFDLDIPLKQCVWCLNQFPLDLL